MNVKTEEGKLTPATPVAQPAGFTLTDEQEEQVLTYIENMLPDDCEIKDYNISVGQRYPTVIFGQLYFGIPRTAPRHVINLEISSLTGDIEIAFNVRRILREVRKQL